MLLAIHLLFGAALAIKINNFGLAVFLAIISHYLLDAFPHWDYFTREQLRLLSKNIRGKKWAKISPEILKAATDLSVGIVAILLLVKNLPLALAGAFFAIMPDCITVFYIIFPENKILKIHDRLHANIFHWFRYKKISLFWKITSQIVIIVLSVALIV